MSERGIKPFTFETTTCYKLYISILLYIFLTLMATFNKNWINIKIKLSYISKFI